MLEACRDAEFAFPGICGEAIGVACVENAYDGGSIPIPWCCMLGSRDEERLRLRVVVVVRTRDQRTCI